MHINELEGSILRCVSFGPTGLIATFTNGAKIVVCNDLPTLTVEVTRPEQVVKMEDKTYCLQYVGGKTR